MDDRKSELDPKPPEYLGPDPAKVSLVPDRPPLAMDDHEHTGSDRRKVRWQNLSGRRVYVRHTIVDADAAVQANYGVFFVAPWRCRVTRVLEQHRVKGSSTPTLQIERLTTGVAPDSGTAMLASAIDIGSTSANNTPVQATLSATPEDLQLNELDRLCLKDSGTTTAIADLTVVIELELA